MLHTPGNKCFVCRAFWGGRSAFQGFKDSPGNAAMELHQIQVAHNAENDRLLLRATFRDQARALHEVRAWLTRRIVHRLWPGILRALETKVTLERPQAQHAKREIVGM